MAQLQGQVTSFADVQAQPNYQNLPTETQAAIAADFFDKRVASQPGYQKAPAQAQQAMRQDFKLKYNVPDIQAAPNTYQAKPATQVNVQTAKPGMFVPGPAGTMGYAPTSMEDLDKFNQGTLSGLSAFVKGATLGYFDPYNPDMGKQAEQIRGIPEFAGMAVPYELTQGTIDKFLPGGGWLGGLARSMGAGGLVGAAESQPGNQLDFGGRAMNALQGAGMAGALHLGGELGGKLLGGLGSLLFKEKPKSGPMLRGKVRAEGAPYGDFGRPMLTRTGGRVVPNTRLIVQDANQFVQDAQNFQGIDAKTTAQMKAKAFKDAFDKLQAQHDASASPTVRARIKQAQAELQRNFQTQKAEIKPPKQNVPQDSPHFQALTEFVQELRKQGRAKEADVAMGQFDRETKAKVYDEVKRRETAAKQQTAQAKRDYEAEYKKLVAEEKASQKRQRELEAEGRKLKSQKEKQAIKDQIALERAESKNRQRELNQLKGEIKARANEQKTQAEQQNRTEQQPSKGKQPGQQATEQGQGKNKAVAQTTASKLKQIRAAIDNKRGLKLEYEAEKHGETGTYRHKTVSPYQVEVNKNGVIQVRAINEEGQIRTYLLGDESGSKIVSAESTSRPATHEAIKHPETGKLTARTREGTSVEQVKKEGIKSSELRADLAKMQDVLEKVKRGEATAEEIKAAAKPMSEKDFAEKTKNLDSGKIEDLCKKVTE